MTTQVQINILYLCIFFLIDLDYKHLVEKQNIFSRQSFSNFYTNAYKMYKLVPKEPQKKKHKMIN